MTTVRVKKEPWYSRIFEPRLPNQHLYTAENFLSNELQSRASNHELTQKITTNTQLTASMQRLADGGNLVLFRQVATPMHETLHIIELAKKLDLRPLIVEFHEDKFVTAGNFYKKSLGKLPIYNDKLSIKKDVYHNRTIVDFNQNVGKKFSEITTKNGESLIDFHHELFESITSYKMSDITTEASDWFSLYSKNAAEYYEHFFTFFLQKNVLAEVFLFGKKNGEFTDKIVNPAFKRAIKKYGVKPLILNFQPVREQERIFWDCYPNQVNDFIDRKSYI